MRVDEDSPAPAWDVPRSPTAARDLVDTAVAHGIDAESCLHNTGLTLTDLDQPDTVVQADQELAIIRNVIALTGNPSGLGIEAGLRYQFSSAGILGFAVLSSATVREALSVVLRYAALGSLFHTVSVEYDGADAVLLLSDRDTPADVRQFVLERDVGAIARVGPFLFGGTLPTEGFSLEITLPRESSNLLAALDDVIPVQYGANRTAVVLTSRILDEPLAAADPHTARICVQQCEDLLNQRRRRVGAPATVRTRLLQTPGHIPSMSEVAGELHITARALRRHLAAAGTSYRALLEEVRDTLAGELLADGLTVEQVAKRLGYSETASFTHAYTRWHGIPPSQHRRPHAIT
jgi:AraC-like DNA-binding protein